MDEVVEEGGVLGFEFGCLRPNSPHRNATVQEVTTRSVSFPSTSSQDVLTAVLRDGAQRLLAEAVEAEVREWIASHAHVTDDAGRRQAR